MVRDYLLEPSIPASTRVASLKRRILATPGGSKQLAIAEIIANNPIALTMAQNLGAVTSESYLRRRKLNIQLQRDGDFSVQLLDTNKSYKFHGDPFYAKYLGIVTWLMSSIEPSAFVQRLRPCGHASHFLKFSEDVLAAAELAIGPIVERATQLDINPGLPTATDAANLEETYEVVAQFLSTIVGKSELEQAIPAEAPRVAFRDWISKRDTGVIVTEPVGFITRYCETMGISAPVLLAVDDLTAYIPRPVSAYPDLEFTTDPAFLQMASDGVRSHVTSEPSTRATIHPVISDSLTDLEDAFTRLVRKSYTRELAVEFHGTPQGKAYFELLSGNKQSRYHRDVLTHEFRPLHDVVRDIVDKIWHEDDSITRSEAELLFASKLAQLGPGIKHRRGDAGRLMVARTTQ